jgi:hypothetical protein
MTRLINIVDYKKAQTVPTERKQKRNRHLSYPQNVPPEQTKIFRTVVVYDQRHKQTEKCFTFKVLNCRPANA